jgi:hypothetical protein
MSGELLIGEGFSLPAEDTLEAAIGIIGKRGRGKSGLVKVLMEELVRVGLPFVAFDPVGIMWGIRTSLDGLGPGLPVLVVGGKHGDLPLDRGAGARIAKAIIDANCSAVLDFSEEPKHVYREFVRDFSHELYRLNDTPRLVILEEAPELLPQRLRPDMTQVFEAVERLVSRGRNKGLGVILVSQRAATVNKDVLTQVDALFVMGLTAPQDQKALAEWVEDRADPSRSEEFFRSIAALHQQEAFFWSPEAFGGSFRRVHVRNFQTFHPDKTHLRRAGLLNVRAVMTDVASMAEQVRAALADPSPSRPKARTTSASLPRDPPRARGPVRELEHPPRRPAVSRERPDHSSTASPPGAVEVVLRSPQATVTVERPVARVTIEEATPLGKVLILLSEGFFDTAQTQGNVRNEIRKRWGIDYNSNGGMWKTLNAALRQNLDPGWGFLETDGQGKGQTYSRSDRPRGKIFQEDVA